MLHGCLSLNAHKKVPSFLRSCTESLFATGLAGAGGSSGLQSLMMTKHRDHWGVSYFSVKALGLCLISHKNTFFMHHLHLSCRNLVTGIG